jgi:uncharacterized protein
MEINLETPLNQYYIRAVSTDGIRVHEDYYTQPFIISSDRIIPSWDVKTVEDICEASLEAIFELQPEVVIIGTGESQVFLPPATQVHFFRRGLGFEVMTTDAACRTFNVLASEGRNVVAALIPLT